MTEYRMGWKEERMRFFRLVYHFSLLVSTTVCVHVWVALSVALSVYSLLELSGVHIMLTHYWHRKTSERAERKYD